MQRRPTAWLSAALAFGLASPAAAQEGLRQATLEQRVESTFAQAGPGTRFGLVVASADGEELVAISPDQRFIPASNTKIFTTAAAFDALAGLNAPDVAGGTAVRLERNGRRVAVVILEGRADARLSSAADCIVNCLAALADAVAAKTRQVRTVVGDDTHFPDERWSPGMSWNNIPTSSGTAISALMLRRIGLGRGTGAIADGIAEVRAMLNRAGVPRSSYDLSDGSGMSTYNRVTPRAMVTLLRWIAARPWGAAWRATLPVGGSRLCRAAGPDSRQSRSHARGPRRRLFRFRHDHQPDDCVQISPDPTADVPR
ncbi:MAG: D-alanyl-D-alanine carboxypeptidase [Sphingomicrobium sp.]